jgi:hypothetical protein
VLALTPSEYLSENEIAAASLKLDDDLFNPQTQLAVRWPAHPVVARAYLDQLERGLHLPARQRDVIEELLDRLEQANGDPDAELRRAFSGQIENLETLGQARSGRTRQRLLALAETLDSMIRMQD